jgi:aubergine-like protein
MFFALAFSPKVGVIIVQKRINTRLFTGGASVQNPPPGVVVDSVVTRQEL